MYRFFKSESGKEKLNIGDKTYDIEIDDKKMDLIYRLQTGQIQTHTSTKDKIIKELKNKLSRKL